jgi:hypothetical protein
MDTIILRFLQTSTIILCLLFFVLGLISVYYFRDNGIVTIKGIGLSTLFLFLSGISALMAIVLLDRVLLPGALILLGILSALIFLYFISSVVYLAIFNRGRRKGKFKEVSQLLKNIFR